MNSVENYAKGGLSFMGGVFSASLVNKLVVPYILKIELTYGNSQLEANAEALIAALLEITVFMIILGAVGGRMDATNQLFFTIGLFGSGSYATMAAKGWAGMAYKSV